MAPMHDAAKEGDVLALEAELDKGENVDVRDEDQETALFDACRNNKLECARTLLRRGADPNAKSMDRTTPLHIACYIGAIEFVRLALEAGADKDVRDHLNETPRDTAQKRNYPEIVALLDSVTTYEFVRRREWMAKVAAEKEAAATKVAEEAAARKVAATLGLLQPLADVKADTPETIAAALAWCSKECATSVADIVDHDLEGFLSALNLKSIPAKKLRGLLQPISGMVSHRPGAAATVSAWMESIFGGATSSGASAPIDQYQGLTNEEDFAQVRQAKVVHIISSPYYKANPTAGNKAAATKLYHDNPSAGVYVFNPNTGLNAAAAVHGLNEDDQGKEWLRLWTDVLRRTQKTGGTCFVMAKGSGPDDRVIEGGAQKGEINVAELAGVPIEYVYY